MTDSAIHPQQLEKLGRIRDLRLRAATLKLWRQRDQAMTEQLKTIWAQRDAALKAQRKTDLRNGTIPGRRLLDLLCEVCNRPFTSYRKPHKNQPTRCPPCAAYINKKQKRESYYRTHTKARQTQNEYFPEWYEQNKRKPPVGGGPKEPATKVRGPTPPATPTVVWQSPGS